MEKKQMTIYDVLNNTMGKAYKSNKCWANTTAVKRVNIFMDLQVWFNDYINEMKIPFRPWCFWGKKLYAQGNTYFTFGDLNDSVLVDGKIKTNICKNVYTLLWQEHRTLEDYKKMIIYSFKEWNNG